MLPLDLDFFDDHQAVVDETYIRLDDTMTTSRGDRQARLARTMIEIDPTNIDAYRILAEHANTGIEAVLLLREAVTIGERHWADVSNRRTVRWWFDHETHPFMRAIYAYGQALGVSERQSDAIACFLKLVEMDPSDFLGARSAIAEMLGVEAAIEVMEANPPRRAR